MVAHTICLAKTFIEEKHEDGLFVLPLQGKCSCCNLEYLWRDFVKPSETIQENSDLICDDDDQSHWTNVLKKT